MPFNEKVLKILNDIKGSGSYVNKGTRDFILPGLEINGLDELSFPINKIQVESLIKIAHKAPFGKGSETILDNTIRSAWEINADQIRFSNPKWQDLLSSILKETKQKLGIESNNICANLYKMLIYEEGDFFLPHKDSEKEKGMFGTLILGLPSKHSGGELIVSFEGETTTINFSEPTQNHQIPYCAFYADCTHEIKHLISGYRVVVVYNLIQELGEIIPKIEPKAAQVTELQNILNENKNGVDYPKVILLGHQYTEENFSAQGLKGNDKTKAETLLIAAEKAGYYAKMGLVTSYQMGQLESDDYGGRSYYDDYDEDSATGTMGEIYDESIRVEHWANDNLPTLSGFTIDKDKIIKDFELNDGEPDEQEADGYTGNAGMEMHYWYHYGAIFLWPKSQHFEILEQKTSYASRIDWLEYYTTNWTKISIKEQNIAHKIVNSLEMQVERNIGEKYKFDCIIDFLILKNDATYLQSDGIMILKKSILNIEISKWNSVFEKYDPILFNDLFSKAFIVQNENILNKIVGILKSLLDTNNKAIFSFLDIQINNLTDFLNGYNYSILSDSISKSIFLNCIYLCQESKDEELIKNIASIFTEFLNRHYTNKILLAIIFDNGLYTHKLALKIIEIAKNDVQFRVNNKPQPPINWSREVPVGTSYRNVWTKLKPFLESPTEHEFLYKIGQADRTEMENAITNVKIDLQTETIRKGSPHTLKLTKNQSFYQSEMVKWNEDVALLEKTARLV